MRIRGGKKEEDHLAEQMFKNTLMTASNSSEPEIQFLAEMKKKT